ncbi:MAG: PhzF family phenazine biosynthesis protein [Gemmatimonadota bacterium]|jgi:trans-2,3-dihydro-3-hydroxyanthranilate isomerase|nr:PhzF family phenazine biosynthesis protein [Gemmatimonadota bacterium]MDQ8168256.1 PhzF family phenazine biosynthesis protein [Gemmatimonadota bacterium]MDQ8172945.1 PhzF family phenazine biosynthesis protein [Gemmatimonadota bacterium]
MRTLRFITADVFTSEPFTGNQLAVVFGAEGLPSETLQAITREFNYSETTFVSAPETPGTTRRVRIFTPGMEVPFAGHPTIGTAHVLVATGEVRPSDDERAAGELTVVLGENVGPVPVRVRLEAGVPTWAQLTTAVLPESRVEVTDRDALAHMLSLDPAELLDGAYAPCGVSCGLPFQMIPLATVAAVSRARLRVDAWEQLLGGKWAEWPMVFAMTGGRDDGELAAHVRGCDIRARVFVPSGGVPEDPATGSANAALAGYLAARTPRDGLLTWAVAQGVEMGRPSRLHIEAHKHGGVIDAVRVGGASVLMSEGTMTVR